MDEDPREAPLCREMAEAVRHDGVVLIVSLERAVRAVTQRMLERRGFRALQAADGGEALERLRGSPEEIAGVVLDLGMPPREARSIFDALRRARSDLPVLFTGGYGEDGVSARLVGAAGTDFLPKPFGLEALAGKADELFGARSRPPLLAHSSDAGPGSGSPA